MTEERLALLERAQQGDDEACRQMLTENAGLIWSIVKRYHHCGVEMDDLYQLGCIGFIKAVKGFDLTYGTQFSTYAVPKIAGEIRRFLRDDGPIKVGRTLREKGQMLWAARERLQNRLSCAPKLSELAEETGLTVEEIASIELAVVPPESLQQETVEGMTLESVLGTEEPETGMVERIALREAIDQLPEQERKAILLRFFKGLTQEQTARLLHVSQVQVSRMERRSLKRLRELLADSAAVMRQLSLENRPPNPASTPAVPPARSSVAHPCPVPSVLHPPYIPAPMSQSTPIVSPCPLIFTGAPARSGCPTCPVYVHFLPTPLILLPAAPSRPQLRPRWFGRHPTAIQR